MDKIVEAHAPDCCLCAREANARKRCAHQDAHRYCDAHQEQLFTLDKSNVCNMPAAHTFLDDALTVRARCANLARRGTTVCGKHGGSSKNTKAARDRRIAKANAYAKAEVIRTQRGFAKDMDPLTVLRFCLDEATNWTHLWLSEVQRISHGQERKLIGKDHLDDQALEMAYQCYTDALDRSARFAKLCLDAGVQERLAKVREGTLELVVVALLAFAKEHGIDETVARPSIARHLRALPA